MDQLILDKKVKLNFREKFHFSDLIKGFLLFFQTIFYICSLKYFKYQHL